MYMRYLYLLPVAENEGDVVEGIQSARRPSPRHR